MGLQDLGSWIGGFVEAALAVAALVQELSSDEVGLPGDVGSGVWGLGLRV